MVDIVFKDMGSVPAYEFDVPVMLVSLTAFIAIYEILMYVYSDGDLNVSNLITEGGDLRYILGWQRPMLAPLAKKSVCRPHPEAPPCTARSAFSLQKRTAGRQEKRNR